MKTCDDKWDGKYRKVRVNVKRKDCSVFAQEGYFNPKPFSEFSKLEKQRHFLALALIENPSLQAPLSIPSNAISCEVNGFPCFLLLAKIPAEIIEKISGRKVEIFNLIFNEENDVVSFKERKSVYPNLRETMFTITVFSISLLVSTKAVLS